MASRSKFIPGKDAKKIIRDSSKRGVALAAEHLLGESRKIVPHETGVLERSGRASTEQSGEVVRGAVSYDTPYQRYCAARKHVLPPRQRPSCKIPRAAFVWQLRSDQRYNRLRLAGRTLIDCK